MTVEAGKTYETRDGREATVVHIFPDGRLLCVIGNSYWRCLIDGRNECGNTDYDLIAPKPEPRRVWLHFHFEGGEHNPVFTECTIDPTDGALRVV